MAHTANACAVVDTKRFRGVKSIEAARHHQMSTHSRALSRQEYLAAVEKPRTRFQVLALGDSGSVRLSERVSVPCYWFERDDLVEDDGKYLVQPDQAVITLFVDGVPSVLFYLGGSRIDSCTFAYQLTPAQAGQSGNCDEAGQAHTAPSFGGFACTGEHAGGATRSPTG